MLFWLLAMALAAGVAALIVPALLAPPPPPPAGAAFDLEVYRDQLGELERDEARGLVGAVQATAARAEIGRRMLAAAERVKAGGDNTRRDPGATATAAPPVPRPAKITALAVMVLVPLGALAVYAAIGHPELPAMPLASRDLAAEQAAGQAAEQVAGDAGGQATEGAAQTPQPPHDIALALEKLLDHLKTNPDDLRGWSLAGRTLARLDRIPEAVEALRHAAALAGDDPDVLGAFGEALVDAEAGVVSDEARRVFDTVLARDATDVRARYFVALAAFQSGDARGALERWRSLATDSPADAPWLPMLDNAIRQAAGALKPEPGKSGRPGKPGG
jgi:cytochrome c-type biogenesis protein CcmH